jgi:hypothetical protein
MPPELLPAGTAPRRHVVSLSQSARPLSRSGRLSNQRPDTRPAAGAAWLALSLAIACRSRFFWDRAAVAIEARLYSRGAPGVG